jgi:hypothetical protein
MPTDHRRVADRLAILDLVQWYAIAVDAQDWDHVRRLFTPDAIVDYTDVGGVRAGIDETIEAERAALAGFAGLHHTNANHVADISGDTARALTYFTAVHAIVDGDGGEILLTVGGHYRDRLRRTADGWRFAERVARGTWMTGPFPEGFPYPPWYGAPGPRAPQLPAE